MVRAVLYLLLSVLLITILRSVIGVLAKMFAGLAGPGSDAGRRPVQMGGELKRDPVCGVYVSTATSVKITEGGQVLHFCSPACRDKYRSGQGAQQG